MNGARIETLYKPREEVSKAIRDGLAAYNLPITGDQGRACSATPARNAPAGRTGYLLKKQDLVQPPH